MRRIALFIFMVLFAHEIHADTAPWWVFFTDRGNIDAERVIAAKIVSPAEPKNLCRRARLFGKNRMYDETDVPVNPDYIAAVTEHAERLRTVSRYFNGVTVDLDDKGIAAVKKLPFVKAVEPVARFGKPLEPAAAPIRLEKPQVFDYGNSYEQLVMVGIPSLHNLGYLGNGIRVAILDSGFENLQHTAFDSLTVTNRWDFVDGDGDIGGDDHGTEVLSVMAGLDHGSIIGAAPYASYMLARTENRKTELRIEEDYWIAGVEWADSLGVDVINSSLGYSEFDDFKYSPQDMDGKTARTTIAADIAVEHGIVVVTSAGNEGDAPWYYITSPADGFGVIAVGSVNRDGVVSSFSSRGPTVDGRVKPDFVALGEQVWVVQSSGSVSYHYTSGTSYAAPSVSGAVALLLEINPFWTPPVVVDSLRASAKAAGPDSLYGYGRIDAYAASGLKGQEPVVSAFRVYDPFPQPLVFSSIDNRIFFPMDVPESGNMLSIKIYTFSGENIKTIEEPVEKAGSLRTRDEAPFWDGTNFTGEKVASGVYYYTVRLAGYSGHTGKIAVIR
ncbi:S8 family serine peptidase [bacterium]|nr:S8 family serine peptidase [bacterium]